MNENYAPEGFDLVSLPSRHSIGKFWFFLRAFRKHHARKPFSVVHGFWTLPSGFLAVVAGKLFGLKTVISVLGGDAVALPEIGYGEMRRWFPRKLILWSLENCSHVIVLTKYLYDNLRENGLKREMEIIPWGIDTGKFRYVEKPVSDPVSFLHIANLAPVKDPETLIRAFNLISKRIPSRLTIIGTGPLKSKLQELVRSLSIENLIIFNDPVPYSELPNYYHKADILLHTSLSEGQSEVVTEAMSCGVVVCGARVGLLYDLPDCGVTVQVKDYAGLAEKITELVGDPTQMHQIRIRARHWTETHSIQWTAKRIGILYESER